MGVRRNEGLGENQHLENGRWKGEAAGLGNTDTEEKGSGRWEGGGRGRYGA